jgi:hypothetical protein
MKAMYIQEYKKCFSFGNRRPYCLKEYQQHTRSGLSVKVSVEFVDDVPNLRKTMSTKNGGVSVNVT